MLLSSDELDLCNFSDFLLQQVQEVSVPLMTLLCEMCILTPIKVLSLGQQMVPTHTYTRLHPHIHGPTEKEEKWPWQQIHNGWPGV